MNDIKTSFDMIVAYIGHLETLLDQHRIMEWKHSNANFRPTHHLYELEQFIEWCNQTERSAE